MRLGQLARKYDISLQDIISFLKENEPTHNGFLPNSKLDEQTEALIEKHFEHLLNVPPEVLEVLNEEKIEEIVELKEETVAEIEVLNEEMHEEIKQNSVDQTVADIEETEEVPASELKVPLVEVGVQNMEINDDAAIDSDRLLELLESGESSIDLSKITLIKAPKKELSGLKVVGKIELTEPKIKRSEISEEQKKDPKHEINSRHQKRQSQEDDLEKNRLRIKRNKEEYEQRQEKQRREKEKKARKAIREVHYKQKIERSRSNHPNNKNKKQLKLHEVKEKIPVPKTLFGKFLRWLNT
jgi:hypothetical protein